MKRILVSAYAVSPIRGSECALGWEISKRLGEYFDVTVLMCEKTPSNVPFYFEIKEYIEKNGNIKNVFYVPVKMPEASKKYTKLHDLGFWPAYYWGYNCWQKAAFIKAKELHAKNPFDGVYQLNMIGFREPGYLWKLNIPYIWGPTNGFHSIPFSFIRGFKGKEFIIQLLKHIANEINIAFARRAKKAARKADIVWCVDETALKKMMQWRAKAELMQETGLNTTPIKLISNRHYDGIRCLNLVWSGMITTGKALNILIEAMINLRHLNIHLTIIGDGPLLNSVKKKSEIISNKITWTGWLSKEEAINLVGKSDLLIHTSLKEGTPHSILEAIGNGVPVVCHETCGMGEVVNDKNGFKIPYEDIPKSVEYLIELLQRLSTNPEILNESFESLWETTNDLTWDFKVQRIAKRINGIIS